MILKNKIYLALAIFGALSIGLIIFIISPLFNEIQKSSQDLISQKQNLLSLETKIENLKRFETLYQDLQPNLEEISSLFVDSKVPVEFISFLETTSQDCQVSIGISPALPRKIEKDHWSSLIFQITSASSFSNLLTFLTKIETSPYLIEIQNLTIRKLVTDEFKSTGVSAAFSIKVFTN